MPRHDPFGATRRRREAKQRRIFTKYAHRPIDELFARYGEYGWKVLEYARGLKQYQRFSRARREAA